MYIPNLTSQAIMFYPLNLTTTQDISSLLSRFNASATNCFAAFCGSLIFLAISTASWLLITWVVPTKIIKLLLVCSKRKSWKLTFQRPSLARMRISVLLSMVVSSISGSDLKCDLRLLSPNARETASCPLTLGTSPNKDAKRRINV